MAGAPKITAATFEMLARAGVPWVSGLDWRVERFGAGDVLIRLPFDDILLRPGGTISGPPLMALADITLYGLVMSVVGRVEMVVTTDLTFHFLARAAPADVLAEGRLLKLGRRLAIGEVSLRSASDDCTICHAVGSYAIPPELN